MKKSEMLKNEFTKKSGFGGECGFSLRSITSRIAELYGSKQVRINVPYSNFNCKGTANRIAKEICGLTPFSKTPIEIEDAKTLFYGDKQVNKRGYYLPFQGECDVFFVDSVTTQDKVLVIDLVEAPSWRMYL